MDTPKTAIVRAQGTHSKEGRETEAAEVFGWVWRRDGAAAPAELACSPMPISSFSRLWFSPAGGRNLSLRFEPRKLELAGLAEALVSITIFVAKMSAGKRETVGGPIDVALISKGDGFVWVKRKERMQSFSIG